MKKLLTKSIYVALAASSLFLSACSRNHNTSISTLKDTDIQWKSSEPVEASQENVTASANTKNLNLTKEDFKLEIKNQFVANNPIKTLNLKEEKKFNKIASKLEKKFSKLNPLQKLKLKEKAQAMKSNDGGVKKAITVGFVGIGIIIVGALIRVWPIDVLIILIGALVLLYGLYLLLDELVF